MSRLALNIRPDAKFTNRNTAASDQFAQLLDRVADHNVSILRRIYDRMCR